MVSLIDGRTIIYIWHPCLPKWKSDRPMLPLEHETNVPSGPHKPVLLKLVKKEEIAKSDNSLWWLVLPKLKFYPSVMESISHYFNSYAMKVTSGNGLHAKVLTTCQSLVQNLRRSVFNIGLY